MRKKIYYIISAIIQMIASIYVIIKANEFMKPLLESAKIYPEVMQERINKLYQNSGSTLIIILAIINIILNLSILIIASRDRILENRKVIITLSIISVFTANIFIIELMAVINIIVMATVKQEELANIKDPEKKKIPILDDEKRNFSKIIMAIILLCIYFSQLIWKHVLPKGIFGLIILIGFYLLMIVLCIGFFFGRFKRDFIEFKNNISAYVWYILPKLGCFYIIFIVVSIVCILITKSIAANQDSLETMSPIILIPLAVIYAPIVEEVLFRGCIRRFVRNDILFIIISGIVFGLLHTFSSEGTLLNMLVMTIPYGLMGSFLAYMYVKTNNIMTNISCHLVNNLVASLLSILITGI